MALTITPARQLSEATLMAELVTWHRQDRPTCPQTGRERPILIAHAGGFVCPDCEWQAR